MTNNEDDENYKMTFNLNQNNEFFDDERANQKHKLINVKRVSLPGGGENWEVLEDGRKVFVLRGVRLTNKEKSVLRTVEGIKLIIKEYKSGNKSITGIKSAIKNIT